ncbi:MAG: ABC transporter substrate-binding protein [Bacillota bacterium]|nr:ABC transporter substrate-binding protein [Bacillota bacterium]
MNLKKLMLLMVIGLLVFTGCGKDSTKTEEPAAGETTAQTEEKEELAMPEGQVEVTFWHGMSGRQEETLTEITNEFMEANPNIKVNLQNQGNYGDLSQKLIATMQSPNNLPTITQAYPDWVYPMLNEGLLVSYDKFINSSNAEIAFDNWDDIIPGLRNGVVVEGQIYGIPFNKSTEVLWYNKTMFEELGLEVPTSFEELKEVSQKVYEAKNIPGVGFDSLSNFYVSYLENKDIVFDSSLDVTRPESIEAANYYLDGIKGGYFRIAGTDKYMSGPFSSEQVAMYVGSNAGESYIKDGVGDSFEYAAAPYPAEKSVQQGTDIYMFASASDDQQIAAYTYLKYLTTKDSQIKWALNTGYMPIRTSAVSDPAYKDSDSKIAPVLAEATANLYTKPVSNGSQQAYNDIGTTLEGLLASPENSAEQVLTDYKATFDSTWQ